jgi:hypothetical protein
MIDVRMRERFREVLDADFKVRCRSGRIIGEIGNLRRPARHQFLMAILSAPSSCGVKARCFSLACVVARARMDAFDSPLNVKLSVMAASVQDLVRNRTRRARPWWP